MLNTFNLKVFFLSHKNLKHDSIHDELKDLNNDLFETLVISNFDNICFVFVNNSNNNFHDFFCDFKENVWCSCIDSYNRNLKKILFECFQLFSSQLHVEFG